MAELAQNKREEILVFVNEITELERRLILRRILPPLKKGGFQKLDIYLKQQVLLFSQKLIWKKEIEAPSSRIWEIFKKVWVLWVESKPQLNEILLEFDNSTDFDKNQKCIVYPNSELDRQCFEILLEASLDSKIDRETIRRFYEFGYFKKDKQIEDLIDKALPHEEFEQRQRIAQLPDQVDRLRQEVDDLRTQISTADFFDELEILFDQRITVVRQSFEKQFSQLKVSQNVSQLKQSISSLKSRISEVNKSLKFRIDGLENLLSERQPAKAEFINSIEDRIAQIEHQVQSTSQSIEERLNLMDSAVADAEIKSMEEEQNQTYVPQIANKAVEIGGRYRTELSADRDRYSDEAEYMENLNIFQRRFGLTNLEKRQVSQEIAAAVHIAMKAFPALEITDERLINIWKLICGDHLHITKINVELGWLGKQDWFPDLFSEECFDKRLEKIDLDISIREMLEIGDMPWAIHLNNCDKSYPDSYLPSFLDWIKKICGDSIRVFLTRCAGSNRCITNEDFYERIARLPKPNEQESINVRYLEDQYIVKRSDWVSWCCPNTDVILPNEDQRIFINQLRSTIEENGIPIPIILLREIQHYLQLSHNLLASTCALDWALTLRFLPWIGNRRKLINRVLNMPDFDDSDFPHFSKGLRQASENSK